MRCGYLDKYMTNFLSFDVLKLPHFTCRVKGHLAPLRLRVKCHEVAFGCCLPHSEGGGGREGRRRDIFSDINPNTWEIELTAAARMDGGEYDTPRESRARAAGEELWRQSASLAPLPLHLPPSLSS